MRIVILAFPGVQLLDVIGPLDVFHEAQRLLGRPVYQLDIVALAPGPVSGSSGVQLLPGSTISQEQAPIDTLLVAGSPEINSALAEHPHAVQWLQQQATKVRRLGSVCTGTFALAMAGLLDGHKATTHWNSAAQLATNYPCIEVAPDSIYVKDGSLYTSAGVTAGMDLALALVEEDLGRELALRVARELVMFFKRPGGQSQFSTHLSAQMSERSLIRDIQVWVVNHLGDDLSLEHLALLANMSPRNFSRTFKKETQTTPAAFVEEARLEAARRMLEDSALPLKRVADNCGFGDMNNLRRAFLRRLGVSPSDYRRRFQQGISEDK
ncbi:MAG: GlxA family transcriptional regulator [Rhodocyclaceae bacterium]|nr:MAG: GlxA family transcriptional regulator [Rhodocyclaceae bacterium]